jgi:glycosyltransferase involved in cell wall biosynthesis
MGNPDSLLHRGLGKIAGFLYRRCDRVVVVTPAFKQYLIENWKTPPDKISIVENGVETDLFSPGEVDAELSREVAADGKFVVGYIGTMGMAHGLETLVEAAAHLQTTAPEVLFLLVGEGAEKDRIITLAKSRGLTNLRFVDQQPREKIPAYIRLSDACLVLLKKTELFKTVIPTKMLEFMSCGRPLILGVDGQARKIMQEAQAGIFVEPEDAAALAQAVTRLAADAQLRSSLGNSGRRYILQFFARQQTAENYINVLAKVVRESGCLTNPN